MSRHINHTPDELARIRSVFEKFLNRREVLFDRTFTAPIYKLPTRCNLHISELAFLKMRYLVERFDTEVGWHGFAERTDDGYFITDITVYPQEVTSATVTTDQDVYEEWLAKIPDEKFQKMRFHGHSHVRMGVTPSSTDEAHQSAIVASLDSSDFYVFMVTNKQRDMFIRIFDCADNMIYENADIDVSIVTDKHTRFMDLLIEADRVETGTVSHFYPVKGRRVENGFE